MWRGCVAELDGLSGTACARVLLTITSLAKMLHARFVKGDSETEKVAKKRLDAVFTLYDVEDAGEHRKQHRDEITSSNADQGVPQ